jgi:predicted DNA-binding transcriptional regulator AlpA
VVDHRLGGLPISGQHAAVLSRVQVLRSAPPLRAPAATWTRPPRGGDLAIIIGSPSILHAAQSALIRLTTDPRRVSLGVTLRVKALISEGDKTMQRNNEKTTVETLSRETWLQVPGRPPRRRRRCLQAALRPSDAPDEQSTPGADITRTGGGSGDRISSRVPSVGTLIANPTRASEIPANQIPAFVAQLASEQTALSALQGALTARLVAAAAEEAASAKTGDRLLTVDEVARTLGVTRRWVQRRARRLPFARKISDHAVRYSEAGLKRWMANRQMRAA